MLDETITTGEAGHTTAHEALHRRHNVVEDFTVDVGSVTEASALSIDVDNWSIQGLVNTVAWLVKKQQDA